MIIWYLAFVLSFLALILVGLWIMHQTYAGKIVFPSWVPQSWRPYAKAYRDVHDRMTPNEKRLDFSIDILWGFGGAALIYFFVDLAGK